MIHFHLCRTCRLLLLVAHEFGVLPHRLLHLALLLADLLHMKELYTEEQCSITRDGPARSALSAVGEVRGNVKHPGASFTQALQALFPSLDHLACAKLERDDAGVKLLASLGQFPSVVHLDDVTRRRGSALSRVNVCDLQAIAQDLCPRG